LSLGERLAIGLVRGIHGMRGGLRVEVLTDHPEERFKRGNEVFAEGSEEPLTITSAHPHELGWLIRFAEVRDRTAADALRNVYLEAPVGAGESLGRGEYYWHDVVGTAVLAVDGTELGKVEDIYRVGGAEVFVVRGGPFGEFDLPAVRAFIRIFAPKRGEIVVDVEALDLTVPKPKKPRGRRTRRAMDGGAGEPATAEEGSTAEVAAAAEGAEEPAAAE
jgi:16S rRNA processing protein RimM